MPTDDIPLFARRQDASGGINSRMSANIIGENQFSNLENVDIVVPGERTKRPGSYIIDDILITGTTESVTALADFNIQGGIDQLLAYIDGKVYKSEEEGAWEPIISGTYLGDTPGIVFGKEQGISPDDVAILCDGTNNAIRLASDGDIQDLGNTNESPPITDVWCWYNNRFWGLLNDNLYFSDAYDSDYSGAFDRTTNRYRIPVGEERVLLSTRDLGILVMGKRQIWSLQPSLIPAATDQPVPLFTNLGIVSKHAAVEAGDDVYFFSNDGLHAVKRNMNDKLQLGTVQPISFPLLDEFEAIDFNYISRLHMTYFDNKIFVVVPTSATTFDTWIYYPAYQAFTIAKGIGPYSMTTHSIDGETRMYYGAFGTGKVYRGWTGTLDEVDGIIHQAIEYVEEGRSEDYGQPLKYKDAAEIEIEARGVDDNTELTVYVSTDNNEYVTVGAMQLPGAVSLPVTLPFIIRANDTIREKFHLDSIGRFRTIKVKIVDNSANSAEFKIYSVNTTCFLEEYEEE